MASDTAPFTPWMSATTAMIDDTATMLPSSVSSDRSLLAQIDAERQLDRLPELLHGRTLRAATRGGVAGRFSRTSSASNRLRTLVERPGDRRGRRPSVRDVTSKYRSPAMPTSTGTNTRLAVADDEHALDLLAGVADRQFGRGGRAVDAAGRRRS